jgi:hypothetical protein
MCQQKKSTGRKHTHWYGLWRFPKTHQERKANQDWPVRAKRRPANLADVRDEHLKGQSRCWKNYRRTQYHGN